MMFAYDNDENFLTEEETDELFKEVDFLKDLLDKMEGDVNG